MTNAPRQTTDVNTSVRIFTALSDADVLRDSN